MFEKVNQLMEQHGYGRMLVTYLALGARNGMEDPHAAGAFDDDQAPTLNRAIRNALFEGWTADNAIFVADEPASERLRSWYAEREPETWGQLTGSDLGDFLAGICHHTVQEVMVSQTSHDTAAALADAAVDGLCEAYATWHEVMAADTPDDKALFAFSFTMASIPDYWEPAELSADFQALVD